MENLDADNKFSESLTKHSVYSASSSYSDPMMTGLMLGRRKEYGDDHSKICFTGASSAPVGPAKRSRASYQNMQNPCCQVEGCNLDLKSAKDYHRRHRICESHSKSPRVIVSGMERRFCQQCSRFHDLSEFDDKKRSCRRRLSDHNARRRRVQSDSVQLLSAGLSSALYDQRQHSLLLNGHPIPHSNSTWEDANAYMLRQGLIRPTRTGGLEGTLCYSSDEMRKSFSELHMDLDKLSPIQSSNQRVLDQCLHIPTVPDLLNAHSLLSSNPWSLNEGQPSSINGGLHVMRKSNSEPQSLSGFHSYSIMNPVEQGPATTVVHSADEGISHQQEYQLFKVAAQDSIGFCSGRRNL